MVSWFSGVNYGQILVIFCVIQEQKNIWKKKYGQSEVLGGILLRDFEEAYGQSEVLADLLRDLEEVCQSGVDYSR